MIDIDRYEHFSFDLWMTLIRSHPEFKAKRDELFKQFFDIEAPIERVKQSIRHFDLLANKMSERSGRHIHASHIYSLILQDLEMDLDTFHQAQFDMFMEESSNLFLSNMPQLINPALHQLLLQINQAGKTANILSNTAFIHGQTLRKVIDHYQLTPYFSFQLYSDEMGLSKPNPAVFECVVDKANENKKISLEQIIHIGDNPIADIAGAQSMGMQAYLIEN